MDERTAENLKNLDNAIDKLNEDISFNKEDFHRRSGILSEKEASALRSRITAMINNRNSLVYDRNILLGLDNFAPRVKKENYNGKNQKSKIKNCKKNRNKAISAFCAFLLTAGFAIGVATHKEEIKDFFLEGIKISQEAKPEETTVYTPRVPLEHPDLQLSILGAVNSQLDILAKKEIDAEIEKKILEKNNYYNSLPENEGQEPYDYHNYYTPEQLANYTYKLYLIVDKDGVPVYGDYPYELYYRFPEYSYPEEAPVESPQTIIPSKAVQEAYTIYDQLKEGLDESDLIELYGTNNVAREKISDERAESAATATLELKRICDKYNLEIPDIDGYSLNDLVDASNLLLKAENAKTPNEQSDDGRE